MEKLPNQTIDNAIKMVETNFSSIYTKEDVVRLLMSIQVVEENTAGPSADKEKLLDLIRSAFNQLNIEIQSQVDDVLNSEFCSYSFSENAAQNVCENCEVDNDECTYDLEGNRIIIDHLALDEHSVRRAIEDKADELLGEISNQICNRIDGMDMNDFIPELPEEEPSKDEVVELNAIISKDAFDRYVEVQREGEFNMLSPDARNAAELTKEEHQTIIKNYEKLQEMYPYMG